MQGGVSPRGKPDPVRGGGGGQAANHPLPPKSQTGPGIHGRHGPPLQLCDPTLRHRGPAQSSGPGTADLCQFRPFLGRQDARLTVKLGTPTGPILVDTGAQKRSILVKLEAVGGPILFHFGPPSQPLSAAPEGLPAPKRRFTKGSRSWGPQKTQSPLDDTFLAPAERLATKARRAGRGGGVAETRPQD